MKVLLENWRAYLNEAATEDYIQDIKDHTASYKENLPPKVEEFEKCLANPEKALKAPMATTKSVGMPKTPAEETGAWQ